MPENPFEVFARMMGIATSRPEAEAAAPVIEENHLPAPGDGAERFQAMIRVLSERWAEEQRLAEARGELAYEQYCQWESDCRIAELARCKEAQ